MVNKRLQAQTDQKAIWIGDSGSHQNYSKYKKIVLNDLSIFLSNFQLFLKNSKESI